MPDDYSLELRNWVRDGRGDRWLSELARSVGDRPGASLGVVWPLSQAMRYLSLPEDQRQAERRILRERLGLGAEDPSVSSRRIGHLGLDRMLDHAERLLAMPQGERLLEELILIQKLQQEAQDEIRELGLLFAHDLNPLHVWMAYALADMYSLDMPNWVGVYLRGFANALLEILLIDAREGGSVGRQAELIGKLLGFGTGGPGTSVLQSAAGQRRDRKIFNEVSCLMEAGEKKYRAYEIVAHQRGVGSSTVQKAYNRHLRRTQERDGNQTFQET